MNDSFELMRRAWLVCLLVACGEHPSLRVEVTHHPDAKPVVARTTISVYESEVVSCDKVELGDLSDGELTAIEVDQITVAEGERSDELTMSREGTKVIVARGFDEAGALIAAGCAEKGIVGEGDVLPISTELAATVSVNGIGLDDADPFGIVVTVTDPFVRSLDARVVSWRVHGSDGAEPLDATDVLVDSESAWVPAGPPCTNGNGVVRVHPVPPSTIGGFATAVRTSWSTEPPRVFSTFTPINANGVLVMKPVRDGTNLSLRRCAARIQKPTSGPSIHRLVCLQDLLGTPTAIDYAIDVANGGATFDPQGSVDFPLLPPGETPIDVFSITRGEEHDVYAITTRGRVIGLFGAPAADPTAKLGAGSAVTDVAVLPACGTSNAALLVRVETTGSKSLQTLAVSPTGALGAGEQLEPYPSPTATGVEQIGINSTGCLAELQVNGDPIVRQVGVVDITGRNVAGSPRNATTAHFDCESGMCSLPFAVPRAGVGFLPADALQHERMVGATFDASGTILSVTVLQPDKDRNPRLVELERITAASFPQHVVSGQFDADGFPDLFWDIANLNNTTTNFQLSYAHQVLGDRLSALSGTQDVIVVDTFVADVTGDGKDDVVIMSQDALLDPKLFAVLVIPGQAPIPPFNIPRDDECAQP